MNAPIAKEEQVFLVSRDTAHNPTIWGPHLLTWLQHIPGVWFLIDIRRL